MGRNEFWDRDDINNATHIMIYNRKQIEAGDNKCWGNRDNLYRYWSAQAYIIYEREQIPRVKKVYDKRGGYKKKMACIGQPDDYAPPRLPVEEEARKLYNRREHQAYIPQARWKPERITPDEVKAWEPAPLTWD
jgi:hypothetical protein